MTRFEVSFASAPNRLSVAERSPEIFLAYFGSPALLRGATGFSIDEPDFTVASLRSTAVLRWELTPGSTLFVVWQQSRQGSDPRSQPLHAAAPDVVTQPGIHSLAIKLSYWFG